jgi:hypothetical protein
MKLVASSQVRPQPAHAISGVSDCPGQDYPTMGLCRVLFSRRRSGTAFFLALGEVVADRR